MAHKEGQDQDDIPENWLSGFEDQCLEDFDSETKMEDTLQRETEFSLQKLFSQFQNSATAIAQLYKGIVLEKISIEALQDNLSKDNGAILVPIKL